MEMPCLEMKVVKTIYQSFRLIIVVWYDTKSSVLYPLELGFRFEINDADKS